MARKKKETESLGQNSGVGRDEVEGSTPRPCSPTVWVRCYQELGDMLPPSCRGRTFPVHVREGASLASLLNLLRLPRKEVDLALINGCSAGASHPVRNGDLVSLYPVFESMDIAPLSRLRRTPLRRLRFVADHGLEELAALLARSGQDVREVCGLSRTELARQSLDQGNVLLTRDPGLIREHGLEKAYVVRAWDAETQLREVLGRFQLDRSLSRGFRDPSCPDDHR